jgi:outer membrane protein
MNNMKSIEMLKFYMATASFARITTVVCAAILLANSNGTAQETLTRDQAIKLALEYNYDIKVAQKGIETAKNNSSIYNSGFLPTATLSGGATVTYNAGENRTVQGDIAFDPAQAFNYNASVGINYVIFNGLGRSYNYKQLKEQHKLTELQAKQIIENTLIQLSTAYFQVAQLEETEDILQNAVSVSNTRLERARYSYEYGQATQLEVLNAEVDVNNDSISLINTSLQLDNAKRNLNLILGRTIDMDFAVDTALQFAMPLSEEELTAKALERNVQIEQTQSQLRNNDFALKASRAGWFPSLSANAAYAYAGSENPNGAFLTGNQSYGPQAGLSLSWNLFDGGRTRTQMQSARIARQSLEIQQERTQSTLKRDVLNAYATYRNTLFVLQAQHHSLTTSTRNFERTNEMYRQGQITSIQFRQAQLNLLNAQSSLSQAKYAAKNAELRLKQLAGVLLED